MLAERIAVDHGAQAAADEALDFERAAALRAARRLARCAAVRGARQHAVLGCHPALALALEKRRHLRLDRGRAEHARVAELGEHGALGMPCEVRRQLHVAHFVVAPTAWPHTHSIRPKDSRSLPAHALAIGGRPRYAPCQRTAVMLVLSLWGAFFATARSARTRTRLSIGVRSSPAMARSASSSPDHNPSVHTSNTSPAVELFAEP